MSFEANEYGRSIGAPGLIVPGIPAVIDTGILQVAVAKEGGFLLFGQFGAGDAVWPTKATASSGAKRTFDITPTLVTAAAGTVTVLKNGVSVATATTTSESTVATVIDSLVASWNDTLYVVTDGTTKLDVEAASVGALQNSDVFTVSVGTSGFTAVVGENDIAGADVVVGGYFKGIAQRVTIADEFEQYEALNVISKGRVWATVYGDVLDGQPVYFDSSYNITATSSGNTAISGATFKTSASDGELSQIELS